MVFVLAALSFIASQAFAAEAVVEEKVMVKDAAKKIVPVPAEYEIAKETVELAPASKRWLAGKSRKAMPASPSLLAAVTSSGSFGSR